VSEVYFRRDLPDARLHSHRYGIKEAIGDGADGLRCLKESRGHASFM